jgi:hypothetical protein
MQTMLTTTTISGSCEAKHDTRMHVFFLNSCFSFNLKFSRLHLHAAHPPTPPAPSLDDFLTDRQIKQVSKGGPAVESQVHLSATASSQARTDSVAHAAHPPLSSHRRYHPSDGRSTHHTHSQQLSTSPQKTESPVGARSPQHSTAQSPGARPVAFDWNGFELQASLQATNQRLLTELDAARQELADARLASDAPLGAAAASARVSSLSKRNRDLTASLGAERARLKNAQKEVRVCLRALLLLLLLLLSC